MRRKERRQRQQLMYRKPSLWWQNIDQFYETIEAAYFISLFIFSFNDIVVNVTINFNILRELKENYGISGESFKKREANIKLEIVVQVKVNSKQW